MHTQRWAAVRDVFYERSGCVLWGPSWSPGAACGWHLDVGPSVTAVGHTQSQESESRGRCLCVGSLLEAEILQATHVLPGMLNQKVSTQLWNPQWLKHHDTQAPRESDVVASSWIQAIWRCSSEPCAPLGRGDFSAWLLSQALWALVAMDLTHSWEGKSSDHHHSWHPQWR